MTLADLSMTEFSQGESKEVSIPEEYSNSICDLVFTLVNNPLLPTASLATLDITFALEASS